MGACKCWVGSEVKLGPCQNQPLHLNRLGKFRVWGLGPFLNLRNPQRTQALIVSPAKAVQMRDKDGLSQARGGNTKGYAQLVPQP